MGSTTLHVSSGMAIAATMSRLRMRLFLAAVEGSASPTAD